MNESRIETAIGMCVVSLTKHIMQKEELDYESSYKKLLTTELYKLLKDIDTRLFLEKNEYLKEAYDTEVKFGKGALYEYINNE